MAWATSISNLGRGSILLGAVWLLSSSQSACSETVALGRHRAVANYVLARLKSGGSPNEPLFAFEQNGVKLVREYGSVPGLMLLELLPDPVLHTVPSEPSGHARNLREAERLVRAIRRLTSTGKFAYVEPDYVVAPALVPSDAAYGDGRLWALNNLGQNPEADINAAAAWDLTTGSTDVVAVVIDSGIRFTHQELASQMWINPDEIPGNGLDDDHDGYVDNLHGISTASISAEPFDHHGHGTQIAGIIGARANGGGPHVGIAWNVRLMSCKSFFGDGRGLSASHHAVLECIDFAIAEKGRLGSTTRMILNCSWSQGGASMHDATRAAGDAGILYVAAAGNETFDLDRYPTFHSANFLENMVCVTAIRSDDRMPFFANRGTYSVHLGAPGSDIFTTGHLNDDDYYASFTGTSAAAPHAVGVAALVWSRFPDAPLAEVRQRLILGAIPIPELDGWTVSGGRLNAFNSLTVTPDNQLELELGFKSDRLAEAGEAITLQARVADLHLVLNASVTGLLSTGVSFPFLDDGISPDERAGDGVYSATFAAPFGVSDFTLEITATAPVPKQAVTKVVVYSIEERPPNDLFVNAENILHLPAIRVGSNARALREAGEPDLGWSGDSRSVWWSWTATANGIVSASTKGSSFDTLLGVCTGQSLASLSLVAASHQVAGGYSQVLFYAEAGVRYHFLVDGFFDNRGDVQLNLDFAQSSVNDHFANRIALTGAEVNVTACDFGATAESAEPHHAGLPPMRSVWWEWRSGDVSGSVTISTAGSAADTRLAVYEGDQSGSLILRAANDDVAVDRRYAEVSLPVVPSRSYHVVVDSKSAAPGMIELSLSGKPENDDFHAAPVLAGEFVRVTGMNLSASGQPDEPGHAPHLQNMKSIWWRWIAPRTGEVVMSTHDSGFDTTLEVFTGLPLPALTSVAFNDNRNVHQTDSLVGFPATENTTYHIRVSGHFREGFNTEWEYIPPWVGSGRVQLVISLDGACHLSLRTQSFPEGQHALVDLVGAPLRSYLLAHSFDLLNWTPASTSRLLNSRILIEHSRLNPEPTLFFRVEGVSQHGQ